MTALRLHRWNLTPREAARVQLRLRSRFESTDRFAQIELVAGADIAIDPGCELALPGVIVYPFPEMPGLERVWMKQRLALSMFLGRLALEKFPCYEPPRMVFAYPADEGC